MRLLDTNAPGLHFEEFEGNDIPAYAILSHTWFNSTQEISYQDAVDAKGEARPGYQKIIEFKKLSASIGLNYCWIDTCCIDKKSSSELSEAINSMYEWYANAWVCYVYLVDYQITHPRERLRESRWFTRGWTLQELIAPEHVVFYDKDWNRLWEKNDEHKLLSSITGIPTRILQHAATLEDFSVAQRMSWAANRTTSRIEDEAYALMGLFDVNMPLLYGEKEKAFQRLQEAIMKTTTDQSIFAWTDPEGSQDYSGLLARRPICFANSGNICAMGRWGLGNVHGLSAGGEVGAHLYLIRNGEGGDNAEYIASLDCWMDDQREETVGIYLKSGNDLWTVDSRCFYRFGIKAFRPCRREEKVGGAYRDVVVRKEFPRATLVQPNSLVSQQPLRIRIAG